MDHLTEGRSLPRLRLYIKLLLECLGPVVDLFDVVVVVAHERFETLDFVIVFVAQALGERYLMVSIHHVSAPRVL